MNFTCFESDPPPQPIDVKTTNILATNSAEVHHISYLQLVFLRFIWCLLFIAVTFSLNSPSLPALTYFQEVTHPFLKMSHKTNHARFWKWSPCKMAAPLRGNIRPLWLLPAPPPPPLSFILTSQCSLARWFYSSKLIILSHRGISSLSF